MRRASRQRGGLQRLGLSAAKRLPTSTKDAPPIPDLLSSATRGCRRRIGGWGDAPVTKLKRNQVERM